MTEVEIETHNGAVYIQRNGDLMYLETKGGRQLEGVVGLSIDEAMIVGKVILKAADEARRALEEKRHEELVKLALARPGVAKTWEEWTAQARSMLATAANAAELQKWVLRQSEVRFSLQPSQEEWENGLKKEIAQRIDELEEKEARPPAEPEEEEVAARLHAAIQSLMCAVDRLKAAERAPELIHTPMPDGIPEDEISNWNSQVVYADMMDNRRAWDKQEQREKEAIDDLRSAAAALVNAANAASDRQAAEDPPF